MMQTAIDETVTVRTRYVGQHLRVQLVREADTPYTDDAPPGHDVVQAELVIEPGCRVTIGTNGVRIETLDG